MHRDIITIMYPGGTSGKQSACQSRRHKRHGFNPWVGKMPWRRKWQPAPVFLPGESHGHRRPGFPSWVGKIPWRRKWQPIPVLLPGKSHGQSMGCQRVRHNWAHTQCTLKIFSYKGLKNHINKFKFSSFIWKFLESQHNMVVTNAYLSSQVFCWCLHCHLVAFLG